MNPDTTLPLPGLPGLDGRFRRVRAVPGVGADAGTSRTWHYLDTADELAAIGVPIQGTILAVHGNPTWSYLWRKVVTASVEAATAGAPAWRVIAIDHLDMGFSERTGIHRPLAQRVADLSRFHRRPRARRPRRHARARLGWRHLPRLGGRSPRAARGCDDAQHRHPPSGGCPDSRAAASRRRARNARRLDGAHLGLPRHDPCARIAGARSGRQGRVSLALPGRVAPWRRRRFRRRHPRERPARELRRTRPDRHRRGSPHGSRADAVGTEGSDLRRPLPRRPRRPPAAREHPPVRGRGPHDRRRAPLRRRGADLAQRTRADGCRRRRSCRWRCGRNALGAAVRPAVAWPRRARRR